MSSNEIDHTDMAILYLLQENARGHTNEQIAEKVGVSSTTVGTRIRQMEEKGVIDGYDPNIGYEEAGFDHHYVVICTVDLEEREESAAEAIENVTGVVKVRKFLTASENMSVEVVAFDRAGFEESLQELNDLGVVIERFELVDSVITQPFNHFGEHFVCE